MNKCACYDETCDCAACSDDRINAKAMLVSAAPDLLKACRAALSIAWETGCESEDGVMTLLDDGRGDLFRTLTAALAKAGDYTP
jgi:hypothetical protein